MSNGNEIANITTATFRHNVVSIYTLRVIVPDGLMKESISEVEVSINLERSDARSGDAKVRVERLGKRSVMATVDRVIMRFDIDTNNREGPFRMRIPHARARILEIQDHFSRKNRSSYVLH